MGDFKNLKVWKDAKDIAVEIYKITEDFKDYQLVEKLRCILSLPNLFPSLARRS